MQRTNLRNLTRLTYNKETNIYVSIFRQAKRLYFENVEFKNLSGSRKFQGTVKPLFSNKIRSKDSIALNEDDILTRNEYKIANILILFLLIQN